MSNDAFQNPFAGTSGEQTGGARYPNLTDGSYIVATRQCISKNKFNSTTTLVIHEFDVMAVETKVRGKRRPMGGGDALDTVTDAPGTVGSYLISFATMSAKRNLADMARSFLGLAPNSGYDEDKARGIVAGDPSKGIEPGAQYAGHLHRLTVQTRPQKNNPTKDYCHHYWHAIDQDEAKKLIAQLNSGTMAESDVASAAESGADDGGDLDL